MIREYVTLKNRTQTPVTFTYGGDSKTVAAGKTLTVDTEVARFLFTCDQVLGLRVDEDGQRIATYKLGIVEGPDSLLDLLEPDVFECADFVSVPTHEHPDLAATRDVQVKRVGTTASDFRTGVVAVR